MIPILGLFALVAATAFAGAAIYINVAEHPARMQLDPRAQLTQWKPSYAAATVMQVSLAVTSTLLGLAGWWASGNWRWAVGALLIFAVVPYTLLGIMPTNRILKGTPDENAGRTTSALLQRWARLHAVRSGLAWMSAAAYVWAAISSQLA